MARNELVNNIDHKDLKIITERSKVYGDDVWYGLTFPDEFKSIQAYYPIFFQKDAGTGQFFPLALFGFQNNENLFLTENSWDAGYIPLSIARQPFLIGMQKMVDNGVEQEQRVLHLDVDHPRVNTEKVKRYF